MAQERRARGGGEAARGVDAVEREGVDPRLPAAHAARAATFLLDAADSTAAEPDWSQVKAALEDDMASRLR